MSTTSANTSGSCSAPRLMMPAALTRTSRRSSLAASASIPRWSRTSSSTASMPRRLPAAPRPAARTRAPASREGRREGRADAAGAAGDENGPAAEIMAGRHCLQLLARPCPGRRSCVLRMPAPPAQWPRRPAGGHAIERMLTTPDPTSGRADRPSKRSRKHALASLGKAATGTTSSSLVSPSCARSRRDRANRPRARRLRGIARP